MDRTALWPQVIFDEIGVEDPDSWYKDPAWDGTPHKACS